MADHEVIRRIRYSLKKIADCRARKEQVELVFCRIQQRYRTGVATLADLLRAEDEVLRARKQLDEALLSFMPAEADLPDEDEPEDKPGAGASPEP